MAFIIMMKKITNTYRIIFKVFILFLIYSISIRNSVSAQNDEPLITSLDNLRESVLEKIDSDVETTGRAFWDAYNIERSRHIADFVLTPLTVIEQAIGTIGFFKNAPEIVSRLKEAEDILQVVSMLMGISQLRESGQKLQLAIDGPTYSSLIQTMLNEAAKSSVPGEYASTVKLHLYGIGGRKSPVGVPHWLSPTAKPKTEILWGVREVKRQIDEEITNLINEVKKTEIGPTVPVNTIQKRLSEITTGIKKSKGDNVNIRYYVPKNSRELVPADIKLGTIGALEQVRTEALTNYDKDIRLEQITVATSAVKAGMNVISLNVGYKTPTGKLLKEVQRDTITPISVLLTTISKTYSSNAREQVNGIPQEMVLSLPGELSNTWKLVDDVTNYIRSFIGLPEVATVEPDEMPGEIVDEQKPLATDESSSFSEIGANDIHSIDFLNFTYDSTLCTQGYGTWGIQKKVKVRDGRFENQEVYFGVVNNEIIYGDLTGDGHEEALVHIGCGYWKANFGLSEFFIFTMQSGHPVLLSEFNENNMKSDYKQHYNNGWLWTEFEDVTIKDGNITIEKFSEGAHCCPLFRVTLKYRWNGQQFVLSGKPQRTPLEQ